MTQGDEEEYEGKVSRCWENMDHWHKVPKCPGCMTDELLAERARNSEDLQALLGLMNWHISGCDHEECRGKRLETLKRVQKRYLQPIHGGEGMSIHQAVACEVANSEREKALVGLLERGRLLAIDYTELPSLGLPKDVAQWLADLEELKK